MDGDMQTRIGRAILLSEWSFETNLVIMVNLMKAINCSEKTLKEPFFPVQ